MLYLLVACGSAPDSSAPKDTGGDSAADTADTTETADTGDSVDCGNGVSAEIVQPKNNSSWVEGDAVAFTGNYNLGVPTWTVDGELVKRAYEATWTAAGVGEHVVGMEVVSSECGTAYDEHTITVEAAQE